MKKVVLVLTTALFAIAACKNSPTGGYDKTAGGLLYKKLTSTNSPKAKLGDILTVNFVTRTQKDSVLQSTRKMGGPIQVEVKVPGFKGDITEGLTMLGAGDSASFMMPVDSMFKMAPSLPKYLKHGEYLKIDLSVISVKSKEDFMKERAAAAAAEAQQSKGALDDYLKSNKIKAQQTASGLYYTIDKKGSGPLPKPGQNVSVNYTGTLLNGTEFDGTDKHGGQPLSFPIGQGRVIKGWDEGIALLSVGSKAHLYIPSELAYGEQGNQGIPPNSPLIFQIEIVSAK